MTTLETPLARADARTGSAALPGPIAAKLRRLIFRTRVIVFIRGLLGVAAVAVACLLAAIGLDALLAPDAAWPRWAVSLSAMGLAVAAAGYLLVRPLARSFSLAGVARAIEIRHPELHERISSAVELLSSTDAPELRGSQSLIDSLARQACLDVSAVMPKREVSLRAAGPYFFASLGGAGLLLGLMLLWPDKTSLLLQRVISPHQRMATILADELSVTPGDVTVAQGSLLEIQAVASRGDISDVQLVRVAGGNESVEQMLQVSSEGQQRVFARTIPVVGESFGYVIRARMGLRNIVTREYRVNAVPIPAVSDMEITYREPQYAQTPPRTEEHASGNIAALAGTTVTIRAITNTVVDQAQMFVNGTHVADAEVSPLGGASDCLFTYVLPEGLRGQYSLRLVKAASGQDFTNDGRQSAHSIEAIVDAPPKIEVTKPAVKTLRLKPVEHLAVDYVAVDKVGLAAVEIIASVDGKELPPQPVELAGKRPLRLVSAQTELNLARLDLKGARTVTFKLRASDGLPAPRGPQTAESALFTIQLDAGAAAYQVQVTISDELAIREMLKELLKELEVAKQDSAALKRQQESVFDTYSKQVKAATEKGSSAADVPVPQLEEANVAQVERMKGHLGISGRLVQQIIERAAGGSFAVMIPRLTPVDMHIREADSQVSQVKLAEQIEPRRDKAVRTDFEVHSAIEIVKELLKQLDALAEQIKRAEEIDAMAQREEDLAAAREALDDAAAAKADANNPAANQNPAGNAPPDAPKPSMNQQEWKKAQTQIAAQLAEMMKKSPAALAEQAKRDAETIRNLAQEARDQAKEQALLQKESQRLAAMKALQQQLKALAQEQAALAQQTAANKATPAESKTMKEAAEDIAKANLDDAQARQEQASGGLKEKAKPSDPAKPTAENMAAAAAAAKQDGISRKTADLNKQIKALKGADEMARLTEQQEQLAREARRLSDQAKQDSPQADEIDTKAAMQAKDAADKMKEGKPGDASKAAQDASAKLRELARRVGKEVGKEVADDEAKPAEGDETDPSPKPQPGENGEVKPKEPADEAATAQQQKARDKAKLSDQAADLAKRQKNLAQQMKALGEKDEAALAAARQKALAEKTVDLAQAAKLIQDHAEELIADPQARAEAAAAGQQLAAAKENQKAATQRLAAKQPENAQGNQQQSAASLDQAAAALDRLGKKMTELAAKNPPKPDDVEPALDEAYDAAREAAVTEELKDAALAAKMLAELSKQASEKAGMAMSPMPGQPDPNQRNTMPGMAMDPKMGAGAMRLDLTAAQLEKLGITAGDWARLRGELRDDVLQAAQENMPPEYRALIKAYFEEVARRMSAGAGK